MWVVSYTILGPLNKLLNKIFLSHYLLRIIIYSQRLFTFYICHKISNRYIRINDCMTPVNTDPFPVIIFLVFEVKVFTESIYFRFQQIMSQSQLLQFLTECIFVLNPGQQNADFGLPWRITFAWYSLTQGKPGWNSRIRHPGRPMGDQQPTQCQASGGCIGLILSVQQPNVFQMRGCIIKLKEES